MCVCYYFRIPFISENPFIFEFLNFVHILLYEHFLQYEIFPNYGTKSCTYVELYRSGLFNFVSYVSLPTLLHPFWVLTSLYLLLFLLKVSVEPNQFSTQSNEDCIILLYCEMLIYIINKKGCMINTYQNPTQFLHFSIFVVPKSRNRCVHHIINVFSLSQERI